MGEWGGRRRVRISFQVRPMVLPKLRWRAELAEYGADSRTIKYNPLFEGQRKAGRISERIRPGPPNPLIQASVYRIARGQWKSN